AMDIRQASSIARAMVTRYGMSEKLGFLLYGTDESRNPWEQPDRLFSDETASHIDEEVKLIMIPPTTRRARCSKSIARNWIVWHKPCCVMKRSTRMKWIG
ncbi:MAG: hypothetical protein HC898_06820, partial [Phycisphaerales bacterium]|nr:hypothetical protein [Phycisphaerales bacterium]